MDMPAILPVLMSWAAALSGYPAPEVAPRVQFQPHRFFVEKVCGSKECNALGWYNDDRTIYIDVKFRDSDSDFAMSLIVHELTHYLQHLSGKYDANSCEDSIEREHEAYGVQNQFIVQAQLRLKLVRAPAAVCNYANAVEDTRR